MRTPEGDTLVHRRWLLPDDPARAIGLQQLSRLWRGLSALDVLDGSAEVFLERLALPPAGDPVRQELPPLPGAGALLAGTGAATLVTQVVWTDEEGRRDPYAREGEVDPEGFRDYTLYAVDGAGFLLLPLIPEAITCGACGQGTELAFRVFGEGALYDRSSRCTACGAALEPGRDRARLRTGAIFLLEELFCRCALSIELPRAPQAEELPDAAVAGLLREAFGSYDELCDDGVAAAE
ncbi:MAG: hypothetical protein NVS2B9_13190 [Myxococcales bacterium]